MSNKSTEHFENNSCEWPLIIADKKEGFIDPENALNMNGRYQ